MLRIEESILATLRNWGSYPALLQLEQGQGALSLSASDLERHIDETSRQLQRWGVRKKYLVPLFLANSTDFVVIFLSLLRLGAIPVMAKMEYRSMEVERIFANARPQAVIVERDHLPLLKPFLANVIVIIRSEQRLLLDQGVDGLFPREDVPDDVASINYTYRGYGFPLGAMVTHAQYAHGARVLQDGLYGQPGERMLVILPMTHIFCLVGCILVPLLNRMTAVITRTMHPRVLFQYIHEQRIDYITSIPEILELLSRLREPDVDLSSLKVFISGGSIASKDCCARITGAFPVHFCHGYGLTECTPVSGNRRYETRSGTVGPICAEIECSIDAASQSDGGEILVKPPYPAGHYYRAARESSDAHHDGWFRTGDLGTMDAGHLVFLRELKRTCKVNGNLVDLEEVAEALRRDPDVREVQVRAENGELAAFLALGQKVELEQKSRCLRSSLRGIIADYKIPRVYHRL